jgi:hypothetical protein
MDWQSCDRRGIGAFVVSMWNRIMIVNMEWAERVQGDRVPSNEQCGHYQ